MVLVRVKIDVSHYLFAQKSWFNILSMQTPSLDVDGQSETMIHVLNILPPIPGTEVLLSGP